MHVDVSWTSFSQLTTRSIDILRNPMHLLQLICMFNHVQPDIPGRTGGQDWVMTEPQKPCLSDGNLDASVSSIQFSYHFMMVSHPTNTSMVYLATTSPGWPSSLSSPSVFDLKHPAEGADRPNRLDFLTETCWNLWKACFRKESTNPDLHRGPLAKWHSTSLRCWKTRSMSCRMNLFQAIRVLK